MTTYHSHKNRKVKVGQYNRLTEELRTRSRTPATTLNANCVGGGDWGTEKLGPQRKISHKVYTHGSDPVASNKAKRRQVLISLLDTRKNRSGGYGL